MIFADCFFFETELDASVLVFKGDKCDSYLRLETSSFAGILFVSLSPFVSGCMITVFAP